MSEQEPILSVNQLSVAFEAHQVLKDVSFEVQPGDVLAIVGPNGAGKSVLFRSLLNLIPFAGVISWAPDARVSYIPQRFSIDQDFPLTVREFFHFKSKNKQDILAALHSVGITNEHHIQHHILNQRVGWLSGGQLQRILIAWSIIDKPDVILLDEPTAGIDVGGEETIYNLIKKLHDERKLTIIMISHDLDIVYRYATNVLCLNKEMVCYGVPAEALDAEALKKMYGEASVYSHPHKHHHSEP